MNNTITMRVPGETLISSIRLERGPKHDRLSLWNRGGHAGNLVVDAGDGIHLAARLFDVESTDEIEIS